MYKGQKLCQLLLVSIVIMFCTVSQSHTAENVGIENSVVNGIINFEIHKLAQFDQLDKLVIDAGHGGKDHGCSGSHSKEKFIVLDIAKRLGELLRFHHPEIEVIYTRETDVFIPLDTRINIANKNKADLFISIHANAVGKKHIRGTETYVMGLHRAEENLRVAKRENASILFEKDYQATYGGYDPKSPEAHILLSMYQNAYLDKSINFATKVENSFSSRTPLPSRGVKQAGFLVLRKATMPSALIETGFLTNKSDENYLLSNQGKNEAAQAILKAITEYKREIEGQYWENTRTTSTAYQEPNIATTVQQDMADDKSKKTVVQAHEPQAINTDQTSQKQSIPRTSQQQQSPIQQKVTANTHTKTYSGATGIPGTAKVVGQSSMAKAKPAKSQVSEHKPTTRIYRIQIAAGKNKLVSTLCGYDRSF